MVYHQWFSEMSRCVTRFGKEWQVLVVRLSGCVMGEEILRCAQDDKKRRLKIKGQVMDIQDKGDKLRISRIRGQVMAFRTWGQDTEVQDKGKLWISRIRGQVMDVQDKRAS